MTNKGILYRIYRYFVPFKYNPSDCTHKKLKQTNHTYSGIQQCSECGDMLLVAGSMIRGILENERRQTN